MRYLKNLEPFIWCSTVIAKLLLKGLYFHSLINLSLSLCLRILKLLFWVCPLFPQALSVVPGGKEPRFQQLYFHRICSNLKDYSKHPSIMKKLKGLNWGINVCNCLGYWGTEWRRETGLVCGLLRGERNGFVTYRVSYLRNGITSTFLFKLFLLREIKFNN